MRPESDEVLVLDSNIFISEIGLTSDKASALKHYLYARGTQLAVPQVVVEECKRHLQRRAAGKVEGVQKSLGWLKRFLGRVGGWTPPEQEILLKKAEALTRWSLPDRSPRTNPGLRYCRKLWIGELIRRRS